MYCTYVRTLTYRSRIGGGPHNIPLPTLQGMVYPRGRTSAFSSLRKLMWRAMDLDGIGLFLTPGLAELDVSLWYGFGNRSLARVLARLPAALNVRTLRGAVETVDDVRATLDACPHLHTLCITWDMMAQPEVLTMLWRERGPRRIYCQDLGTDDGRIFIVLDLDRSGTKWLESLDVLGPWHVLARWIDALPPASALDSLTVRLHWPQAQDAYGAFMSAVTRRYHTSLRCFTLDQRDEWWEGATDVEVYDVLVPIMGLQRLHTMAIRVAGVDADTTRLTDQQMATALPNWPELEHFSLSLSPWGRTALSGDTLALFSRLCPSLKDLAIIVRVSDGHQMHVPSAGSAPDPAVALTTLRLVVMLAPGTAYSDMQRAQSGSLQEAARLLGAFQTWFPAIRLVEYRHNPSDAGPNWNLVLAGARTRSTAFKRLYLDGLHGTQKGDCGERWQFWEVTGTKQGGMTAG